MSELISYNINQSVLVKLNLIGINEMKRQHDELNEHSKGFLGEFKLPKVDHMGYTKFQMHDLMHTFGHMLTLGSTMPFETTILLDTKS